MINLLHNDFDNAFKILETSFPTDEIRPYEEQKALLCNSLYRLYGVFNEKELTAVSAVWEFEDFIYIEHLAVSSDFRNKNIGSMLLNEITKASDKKVCLEVEPPEGEIPKRRIAFYERNGFFLNEFPYIQPPISKGKNPVPLMIMTTGSKLSENEFEAIKTTLYKNVYKII